MKFVFIRLFLVSYISVEVLAQTAYAQQILCEGLSSSSNSSSKDDGSSNDAYSDWQEAEDQASRAHNAEERARYEKDKWRRADDASEAYHAAKATRNASERVYRAALKGDPIAKRYVDRSRAAADRAREDAEQARYYADSSN